MSRIRYTHKIIKENLDIFSEVLRLSFKALFKEGTLPSVFELVDVTPSFKRVQKTVKVITH